MIKRLSSQLGSTSLEALLSIILMLIAFYALWGVSVIIYNQSQITTAAQFASQTAINSLTAIDPYIGTEAHQSAIQTDPSRSEYGLGSPPCDQAPARPSNTLYGFAQCVAKNQAEFVFADNTRSLLTDQFTGSLPVTPNASTTTFSCISDPKPWLIIGDSNNNFATSCATANRATALRATFSAPTTLSRVSFLNFSSSNFDTNRTDTVRGQTNLATATRYQPR